MYKPETGHVVQFTNTYDARSLYYVEGVSGNRVTVSPVSQPTEMGTMSLNISMATFREMGGAAAVVSDEELSAVKAVYTALALSSLELVETAMIAAAVFGEAVGEAILPLEDMEKLESGLDQIKAGIKFLEDAREGAYV
jgi:hypothetical protein